MISEQNSILYMMQEAAQKYSDHVALVYRQRQYTYEELNDVTDRLASYLQGRGIGKGSVVSVLIPRCEYMLITALGILKAGAAYQPLDASYPSERIQYMIKDADSSLIIVAREMEELLGDIDVPGYYMEELCELPAVPDFSMPFVKAEDLFVLLYTSGSTGVPKGCMIQHGNILSFCKWYLSYYQVDETCRMGEHASFVFDVSMMELFMPLAGGASVHIIPEEIRTDLHRLNQYFEEHQITHSSITTQLGRQFAACIENHSLRHLTVAGEALGPIEPPENYQLHNGYGPTEGTILLTIQPVNEYYPDNVPIGRPLDEVEIYVLDGQGRQVKPGETGELCAAGPHITPGYLNQPEQTQKVYTQNPFSSDPAYSRMYHTGDFVRYRSDGLLEYLGRADRQVKIRGFRIELPEIEAALRDCPGVLDAVVSAVEIHREKYLVGYYVAGSEQDTDEWNRLLGETKPAYMIPSFYVRVEEIPLNTNGKVDYSRLPMPLIQQMPYVEPQSETESVIAGQYASLLGVRVGRDDDFLRLGGHSLLAAKLLFRLNQELSCSLTIRDIMQYPVVKELAARVESAGTGQEAANRILPAVKSLNTQDCYPVSKAQRRIYTAQQLCEPGDYSYYLPTRLCIRGRLERERVKAVLKKLFRRHESLRTSFVVRQGRLVQQIAEDTDEWLSEAVRNTEVDTIAGAVIALDSAPLFRWNIGYQEESNETVLQWNWHHIISDGRSILLFCEEFIALYNQKELEPLAIQYKDFAVWEQMQADSVFMNRKRQAWVQKLKDAVPVLDLKADYPPGESGRHRGGHCSVILPKGVSDEILLFCRQQGVTEYMFLLSVWFVLLQKYSHQRDIVVGTVMDGRVQKETENVQGMFVNTVPLLGQIEETASFAEFLQQVKEMVLFAYEQQECSLEEIAEDLKVERTPWGNLLFDVLFVMQSFDRELPETGGCRTTLEFPATDTAMYPLTLEAEYTDGCFHFDFEYNTEVFSEKSISIMAAHYGNLLETCREAFTEPIHTISMLGEEERQFLLVSVQGEQQPFSGETVVEKLQRQAHRNPQKPAVVLEQQFLSYETLVRESGRLSAVLCHYLEPEDFAVIFAERSLEMILGIWGVLQAGGAYVPVSPEYPAERISYILGDCSPRVVITCGAALPESCIGQLKENAIPVITLRYENESKELSWYGTEGMQRTPQETAHDSRAVPEQLAYMIYTSGTTGMPKGVMVEHRQLSHLLEAYTDIYQLTDSDCVLQFANFVFDQSVWDIFHILTVGGTLCLIPSDLAGNPEKLEQYCEEHGVTAASLTPGYLRVLHPDRLPSLRLLDVGGEAPDRKLLEAWAEGRTVFNTYGPTETTVNATSFAYDRAERHNVPIGRAIPNTQVYIMYRGELCGTGVPGELCIAGAGVTRGYWHRDELTEEKYVPNPFGTGRMYRSGDLARYLTDGNIEFLGRIDEQVKIRGYRIELGEIEAQMSAIPEVQSAVVAVKQDVQGDRQLCAYYTLQDVLPTERLRKALSEKLPYYMVPSVFMELPKLPLTVNGKIDKRALPEPQWHTQQEFCAPSSLEEKVCVRAWEQVLQISPIGVLDNFFALGGDSIKAIMIVSILREEGYQTEAKTILESRTIRSLAAHIGKAAPQPEYEEYSKITLTPVMRDYFAAQMPYANHYNQVVMLQFTEKADIPALETALRYLVQYHGMLRMQLRKNTDKEPEIYLRGRKTAAQMTIPVYTDLSEEERLCVCNHLQESMCPENGTVMQSCLFRENGGDFLLLVLHHLVVDEVSWTIVLEDLSRLYAAAKRGTERIQEVIPKPTVSFGEWSEKLSRYPDSRSFAEEKKFWEGRRDILEKGSSSTRQWLRSCCSSSVEGERQFQYLYGALDTESSARLLSLAEKRYHARMDALLLAALMRTLYQTDRAEKLVIQLESHGRGDIGEGISCARTVGWFTAVYPVCIEYRKEWDEQIIWIKEELLAVPNYGIGYGLLKEKAGAEEGILFNYLGQEGSKDYDGFSRSDREAGEEIHRENGDAGTISLNLRMQKDGLKIECCFDGRYQTEKMRQLLEGYQRELSALAQQELAFVQVLSPSELCSGSRMAMQEWDVLKRSIPLDEAEQIHELTPLQQGIFYHWLAADKPGSYVIQDQVTIYGEWRPDFLQKTLELLAQKYDALRMGFVYEGLSRPWQILWKHRIPLLTTAGEGDLSAYAEQKRVKGFDLIHDTLFRVLAVPIAEDRTELLVTQHHIIIDGWSFPILLQDMERYYKMLCAGESLQAMEDLVCRESGSLCRFSDYLRWNHFRETETGLSRWKDYLEEYEESVGIPANLIRRKGNTGNLEENAGHNLHRIPTKLQEQVEQFIREKHITMSILFETLWGLLLQMENNVSDVVFGKTVSGRNAELDGIGNTVGLLINTVPVRVRSGKEQRISELLQSVQETSIQMMPYEHIALSEIQSQTSQGGNLFQTLYVYENYPVREQGEHGFQVKTIHEATNYPITFYVEEQEGIVMNLLYDADSYEPEYMTNLLCRMENFLVQILAHPEQKTADLARITDAERKAMLGDFSGTAKAYPCKTILDLFAERVSQYPEKTAVIIEEQSMTYRELYAAAKRLAREMGCGEERFVAIIAERSLEMIVAIFAALLAGAAYVPIDPAYPAERIAYILKDCEPEYILVYLPTVPLSVRDLGQISPAEQIDIALYMSSGTEEQNRSDFTEPDLSAEALWNRAAYMIYTSGTTGRPKGVVIEHRSLSNMIYANADYYGFCPEDVVLQLANYVFDQSVWDIFSTIGAGAALCLIPADIMASAEGIENYCREHRVTVLMTTTVMLGALHPERIGRLRLVDGGGDAAREAVFKAWADYAERVVNSYGPTEITVNATAYTYTSECAGEIPIGKALPNKKVYIMQGDQLCGIGQAGEICIAGAGLAREYFHEEVLTETNFVPDPYGEGRLYRTGDIGRYLQDGNISYLGRMDEQVKIRGFRIEPGEIEQRLREIAEVKEAAVVCHQNEAGRNYLAAYLVCTGAVEEKAVRQYLRQKLPEYMIPTFITFLDALPLNNSGKLDVRKLGQKICSPDRGYEEPQDYFEDKIAKLYEKILGVSAVGRGDSFFELGGASIDVMKLVSELSEYEITIADVFHCPTPEALGEFLREDWMRQNRKQDSFFFLQKGNPDVPSLVCLPPSGGMTVCYLELIKELAYEGSVYGMMDHKYRSFSALSPEELRSIEHTDNDVWEETIEAYWQALQKIWRDDDILAGYSQGGSVAYLLAQRLERQGRHVGAVLMLEATPVTKEELAAGQLYSEDELQYMTEQIFTGMYGDEAKGILENAENTEDYRRLLISWLVIRKNVSHPVCIGGRIQAPISVIVLDEKAQQSDAPVLLQENPWQQYSEREGLACAVRGSEEDHIIFLSKYKKEISDFIEKCRMEYYS